MRFVYERAAATGRVAFVNGTVEQLLTTGGGEGSRVTGARLREGGRVLSADLVVVAAGAWSPQLVDLSSQVVATGQVLAYLDLTEDEQAQLGHRPVLMNISTGLFVIPPRDRVLKVARHAYGYLNPQPLAHPPLGSPPSVSPGSDSNPVVVSTPHTHLTDPDLSIPAEGVAALREALRRIVPLPELHDRPFARTRLCWYTDTPTADFLVDYHPRWPRSLFVATGGSGHAFKFLPVIGGRVVDCLLGRRPTDLGPKWRWKEKGPGQAMAARPTEAAHNAVVGTSDGSVIVTEDGSRGGRPGLILEEELKR
ncbi:FAD dependent oxidoreductase-domain-containing protein [Durotheca rogersii]|uniref:FAD dependent oxidoreductase-domain-containing protein n=1 Tax=Durotheca rogersii TaxID=419775 RepID=UPI0022209E54|nr:FAD dependent oxidoreductase-domain-containing protein [Durotheca rogersii]KAI5866320.1 FAD dependent oxidoreductase-domain-containing protein [Durotheca rogersii]